MTLFRAEHTGLPSIVTAMIPAGQAYMITGSAHGLSWVVASGVGVGTTIARSDPAAPFGTVTYRVERAGAAPVTYTFEHEWHPSLSRCTDTRIIAVSGRGAVASIWEGDLSMSWSPGASYAQPLNRRRPSQYLPTQPGGQSWDLKFRAPNGDVPAARTALDIGRFWVIHDPERSGTVGALPRVMFAGAAGAISESGYPGGRLYSLGLRELEVPPGGTGVPIVTWGEAAREGIAWGPTTTFASIRQQIAGAP